MAQVKLHGRVFFSMEIHTLTGLHIGGGQGELGAAKYDKLVIRDPLTQQPYIPGSSLRGKMRSLTEKYLGLPIGWPPRSRAQIHVCRTSQEFQSRGPCPVCTVFGTPAEMDYDTLTRLVVRDVFLKNIDTLLKARLEGTYTEFKTEVGIDRVTSVANPRTMERVPPGAVFGPRDHDDHEVMVFNVYELPQDLDRIKVVLQALQLVEDDYLGGSGSRGYGRVAFRNIEIAVRSGREYIRKHPIARYENLSEWAADFANFRQAIARFFPVNGG